jgi:signal transduction histidine kinase
MVVVPWASVREGKAAARASDARLWSVWLAVELALWLAWLAVPRSNIVVRELILYPLAELGAVAAIVVGVRRFRPPAPAAWLLIAAGFFVYCIGDILWGVYEVEGRDPFPSPADVLYLAFYPLVVSGLAIAVLRRRGAVDRRAALDAALVVVSGALIAWIYVIQPAVVDPSLPTLEKLVTVAYPAGDLLLLAFVARFVMGTSWSVRSFKLLVLGLALTLAGDLLFELDVVGSVLSNPDVVDSLLLLGVICVGLAGLHRTMPALTEAGGAPDEGHEAVRLVLLGVIALVPAAVLTLQSTLGHSLYLAETIGAMALIAVLSMLRTTVVENSAMEAAQRESTLSSYADDLLRANGKDALFAVAERSANDLVGTGKARLRSRPNAPTDRGAHAFTAPIEVQGEPVAELVADASALKVERARDSLATVAAQLALALERERLLAAEREAAIALGEQNERLRELDRMKDQFVSSVSHELRTPLTAIVGYSQILLRNDAGSLTPDQRRFLEIVDRNSRRLNELIDDVLITSHMDSGRFSLERTSVDLVQLATEHVESIRPTARQKDVEVRLSAEGAGPVLSGDPMRLGQLLDNLLSNAVKFTPAGGAVGVSIASIGESAHLEVTDTGVGVPAEELEQLFERFFRASTAATMKGTGLGLAIAKSIVDAHGGTISVESRVGVGTTFSVDLPLEPVVETEGVA